MERQFESGKNIKTGTIKLVILCMSLFQFLLFCIGTLLVIIAEIRFTSLVNEFFILFIAHIAGILLPLFVIGMLFIINNNDKLKYLLQRILQNTIALFLFNKSQKLISVRSLIYPFLIIVVSMALADYFVTPPQLNPQKSNIVFLYPKILAIPDIVFEVSILPTMIAQRIKGSQKQIVALPLLSTTINHISSNSEIIIIGAHGKNGYIKTGDGVAFSSSMLESSNNNIKEIYFGSCYVGKDLKGWQEKFPKATIFASKDEFNELQGLYYMLIIVPFKYS